MILKNPIGWCDETINAVTGCDKISPGCKNCYASVGTRARVLRSQGRETWGASGERVPVNFKPTFRRLNKLCICDKCHKTFTIMEAAGSLGFCGFCELHQGKLRRIRLFADSNSDWLDEKWPVETLRDFILEIEAAPNVDVLLLTKRPENFIGRVSLATSLSESEVRCPNNLWFGVSVENQTMADKRRDVFEKIPATRKFVSFEPALSEVDWTGWDFIDWLIVGGESGKDRRDCGVEVIEQAAEDAAEAGIAVYVKQDSDFKSGQQGRIADSVWKIKEFPK